MSKASEPRFVRDIEVICRGPVAAPHPPVLLELPSDSTVTCALCGLRYRRATDWNHLTRATWPKQE